MKKSLFPILLLIVVTVGCNSKTNPNDVAVEPHTISDSVFLENEYGEDYSRYTMNIELPITKNERLRQNIMHWMLSPETEDYTTFFMADMERFFAEEGNEPSSTLEGNYYLLEQSDDYVTYISEGYLYTGGAHPLPWYWGTTFSKADGSMMGYDLFNDPNQLTDLVSENIREQYFNRFNTEEEEYLFEPDEPIQLPEAQPWIENDSVVFCYGPYEIAPYAAGMPTCKIALADLEPYLSEKGKSVLKL